MRTCELCAEPVMARNLCRRHYAADRLSKMPPCKIDGCVKTSHAVGMCQMHYCRWKNNGDPLVTKRRWDGFDRRCEVAYGCDRKHYAKGLCKRHYREQFPERNPNPAWDDRARDRKNQRRAQKARSAVGGSVMLEDIRARDGNRCKICGGAIGKEPWPHPASPSLDHIVPLSCGGEHSPANVQLAHLRCNVAKGNRGGGEQLMLYG